MPALSAFYLDIHKKTVVACVITPESQKTRTFKTMTKAILRHADAIERLRQTRNPKALQDHLGHASPLMTLRYLSTLQEEDSLRIQQDVEFD